MSIATKTGDKGKTSLLSGERVWKDDPRVEAYGAVDELNSFLGDAKHTIKNGPLKKIIENIQKDLFRICAELADNSQKFNNVIGNSEIEILNELLEQYEKKIKLTGFIIPGNSPESAKLDLCRSVCRRAERKIITLNNISLISSELIKYINRLSDLLFILARSVEDPKYI